MGLSLVFWYSVLGQLGQVHNDPGVWAPYKGSSWIWTYQLLKQGN